MNLKLRSASNILSVPKTGQSQPDVALNTLLLPDNNGKFI